MSLVDISEIKQNLEQSRQQQNYLEAIFDTVREPLLVLDEDLKVERANRSYYQRFQATPQDTEGRLIYNLQHGRWNNPQLRKLQEEVLPKKACFEDFAVECGDRRVLMNGRKLLSSEGSEKILIAIVEEQHPDDAAK